MPYKPLNTHKASTIAIDTIIIAFTRLEGIEADLAGVWFAHGVS